MCEEIVRQIIFDRLRDCPAHFSGTEGRVVAFLRECFDDTFFYRHVDATLLLDATDDLIEHEDRDAFDVLARWRMEDDDIIEAIDELW